jgi:DNA topoisomerase I
MHELIITEKPSAAKKIAYALADDKVTVRKFSQVSVYDIKHNKQSISIVSAVGHLFTVAEKKKSFKYPSFDIEWKPSASMNKNASYTKKYADVIAKEAKKAKSFIVACDYDVEGEVIGLNVVRFLCGQKDAKRMKFSTLTKPDLIESYDNKKDSIEWGQAKAGETRHFLDWMYGINLSRALTAAIKKAGMFKLMSSGRVQGPALKILSDREKEIKAFISEPYWQIELDAKKPKVSAMHKDDKIFDKKRVDEILNKVKGKDGVIKDIRSSEQKKQAPYPFDLTTLQTEGYRCFGYTPKRTLDIAQKLYTATYISYPRTSSQQLTPKLGYKKIIANLMKQIDYTPLGNIVLKTKLVPNNGKKTDPAHPAIYPTGIAPKSMDAQEKKIYDLITKRFFATFGSEAVRITNTVTIDVNTELFIAKGTLTKIPGWHTLYMPYVKLKEIELPAMNIGEQVLVKEIIQHDKETQPPKRYTQSSIIKELEKRGLGTKATRAQILQNLIDREYVEGNTLKVNEIGLRTVEILEKYVHEIVSHELTKHFEEEMEKIKVHKKGEAKILADAQADLTKILDKFKLNEDKIGMELAKSYRQGHVKEIGIDPKTNEKIYVKKGKFGPYVQLGENGEDVKFASLPKGMTIDKVTVEDALHLLSLPRTVGKYEDEEVITNIGRYGPYVKHKGRFVSIGNEDPYTINLDRAIELINQKKVGSSVLKEFGKIKIKNGPYGPYVTDGKKNISLHGNDPNTLTEEQAKLLFKPKAS